MKVSLPIGHHSAYEQIPTRVTVVHAIHSTQTGKRELPALLRGDKFSPESDLGSNAKSGRQQVPKAIIVGAGFSREELEEMRSTEGGKSVPWLYPDPSKAVWSMLRGPFFMSHIVKRAKNCMGEHGLAAGKEGQVVPDVWGF